MHDDCENWSVVTTIFDLSEGIKRTLGLGPNWCTVVVADRKTVPDSYVPTPLVSASEANRLVFLTVAAQELLAESSLFIASIPWNHFGRKNLGYLYAVRHYYLIFLSTIV